MSKLVNVIEVKFKDDKVVETNIKHERVLKVSDFKELQEEIKKVIKNVREKKRRGFETNYIPAKEVGGDYGSLFIFDKKVSVFLNIVFSDNWEAQKTIQGMNRE